MHPQLHEPNSTRQIETVVDGQTVRGTVILTGSSRMRVTLDWPSTILSAGKSMSFFSRVPPGEPLYLGKFGETLAMNLLLSVYEEYKKATGGASPRARDSRNLVMSATWPSTRVILGAT
jgi:hypothetical protein